MFWKILHLFIGGIGLSFLVMIGQTPLFWALGIAYTMVYWWITQPIPIYITALLPLLLGPMSGLISDVELASSYGNKMVFLFFGGFVLALGIEKWNLHSAFAETLIA